MGFVVRNVFTFLSICVINLKNDFIRTSRRVCFYNYFYLKRKGSKNDCAHFVSCIMNLLPFWKLDFFFLFCMLSFIAFSFFFCLDFFHRGPCCLDCSLFSGCHSPSYLTPPAIETCLWSSHIFHQGEAETSSTFVLRHSLFYSQLLKSKTWASNLF